MKVNLDRTSSGFCIGVQGTIHLAEEKLQELDSKLYCLGDIVHNEVEVKRLENLGLITIDNDEYDRLKNAPVLIRAHGEPPSTYKTAEINELSITDSTCPVVSKLQRTARLLHELGFQIIIYGKKAHPEVIGINGQCGNQAIIIKHADLSVHEETAPIDFTRRTALISQTTMDVPGFYTLKENLEHLFSEKVDSSGRSDAQSWKDIRDIDLTAEMTGVRSLPRLVYKDTICRQVSSRNSKLHDFAAANDIIIFVAGKKSSNGQVLFNICKQSNPRCYFIENENDLQDEWFSDNGSTVENVGVCGATSTPMWLLEKVARFIEKNYAS
ncbi:4-hydroxy-3-methylbut-2-enyl diphosphate reductase [Prosthecochloris sp. SCSIO W1101]|uniref:4-hydroxy-3-methylbut-2-enyl diphosphate reductase n=1 Tax=Prosthecochloris sp. SCSIO W1101 TaxID=2992242 RepID=UPI00223D8679|nr:4-hydroxy-3-methylbut-2-enyl diphosphate reductase [Prosthecochloris sp. SCSIO W1101]UZJ41005.1 4-hydroxy-3-methylbut-2-enyl diphosphate reductase [Prosthecochloris sp. SCSIO W1101]